MLPPRLLGNHLSRLLRNAQHRQHWVDCGDGREDAGVRDTHSAQAAHAQLGVHDGQVVGLDIAHARRARRVVDGVRGLAGVVAQGLVGLDLGAGRDLALNPVLEGRGLGDLARGLHAVDERRCVVALGVGEVAEVERRLDGGVCRGQVEAAAGARARDVGRHAKGELVRNGLVAEALRVHGEGDLVAVCGGRRVGGGTRQLVTFLTNKQRVMRHAQRESLHPPRPRSHGGFGKIRKRYIPVHHDIGNVAVGQRGRVCR